jgi:3'(2'), 5'-bisphosphate nucleotidase
MYEKELSVAIQAAKSAGEEIMNYFNEESQKAELKQDKTIVTKADIESNRIIIEQIRKSFPTDGIISEEMQEVKGERKWFIDPLDGTESFVRMSDEFGIHIGLCESDTPVLGVVYRVAKGELYYSTKNKGAFKENKEGKSPLRIPQNLSLKMICVTSYGDQALKNIEEHLKLLSINKVVRAAATGLRILKLADGEADFHLIDSPKVKPWDICAPHAILQEAGGQVSHADGTQVTYQQGAIGKKAIFFTRTNKQLSYSLDKLKHSFKKTRPQFYMVLDLNAIEKEIEEGRAAPVKGTLSAARDFIVETHQGKFFYKQYQDRDKVKDASKETAITDPEEFNRMVYSLPATANIDIEVSKKTKVASEVMATLRWRNLGIPSQELVHYDGELTMIFKYMNGFSFEQVLNGPHNSQEFSKVLDSFHSIRRIAMETKNPEALHSDPYSNNFFFNKDTGLVVPFDSSKVNKKDMSFEEIDARLILFFLSKIFHLKTDKDTKLSYLEQSVERLSVEERKLISDLYIDPKEQREYFESLNLPDDNVIDIYYRTDVRDAIQEALQRKG